MQTVAKLLEQIERRGFLPANQSTFTEAEILSIAGEELKTKIWPRLALIGGEFNILFKDISLVANQEAYDIPEHAFNGVIREIQHILSNQITDLPQIPLEKTSKFATDRQDQPSCFYLRGDKIVIKPTPSTSTGTLRVYYFASCPDLVSANETGVISAIDTNNNQVTLTSMPTTWVTGDKFDFISKRNNHSYRDVNFVSTTVNSPDIIFSESLPSDLSVGDYVALKGESSLVQMPYTMVSVLAQMTAAALLEYAGQDGWQDAKKKADEMLNAALATLTPRVKGESIFIQQTWF